MSGDSNSDVREEDGAGITVSGDMLPPLTNEIGFTLALWSDPALGSVETMKSHMSMNQLK